MKLIDKDALSMELMNEVLNAYAKADFRFAHALNVFQGLIDKAPTVEERKHGHWEDIDLDTSVCSVCKKPQEYETKYCPECGAKMENNGDDDDDDLQAGERFYILDKDYKKMFNKTFYINKNATGTDDILLDNNHFAIYSDTLLYLLTGIAFVKKKPFCPKYGEMVYYVTVSGYIQEVRFDTDSTLHQLLRKAGKLYRSEEEAKRYLDKDYKDLIIQEEE
jgi:hypothetical protein